MREWYVALDRSGHYRSVSQSHRPQQGESFVDLVPRTYAEACRTADELNTVAEVMGS